MLNKPLYQNKLIGFENEFNELLNIYEGERAPSGVILYGKNGIGKKTFIFHLINSILSKNENGEYNRKEKIIDINNPSYKLALNDVHPNLFIVDIKEDKKSIDILQIREMFRFARKSTFNNKLKFIVINNADKLNLFSSNALLKILEEPNEKISFIFIHDSKKNIIETIRSRCVVYKMNINDFDKIKIIKNILPKLNIQNNLFNYYSTPGEIFEFYNFCNENNIDYNDTNLEFLFKTISDNISLIKSKYISKNFTSLIEIYFYNKINSSKNDLKYVKLYEYFLKKINSFNKYNLDLESLLIEFNGKIRNG